MQLPLLVHSASFIVVRFLAVAVDQVFHSFLPLIRAHITYGTNIEPTRMFRWQYKTDSRANRCSHRPPPPSSSFYSARSFSTADALRSRFRQPLWHFPNISVACYLNLVDAINIANKVRVAPPRRRMSARPEHGTARPQRRQMGRL